MQIKIHRGIKEIAAQHGKRLFIDMGLIAANLRRKVTPKYFDGF